MIGICWIVDAAHVEVILLVEWVQSTAKRIKISAHVPADNCTHLKQQIQMWVEKANDEFGIIAPPPSPTPDPTGKGSSECHPWRHTQHMLTRGLQRNGRLKVDFILDAVVHGVNYGS